MVFSRRFKNIKSYLILAAGILAALTPLNGHAETNTITLARQYGIAFIPFLEMEQNHLIEKHARLLGLPNLTVNWTVLSGAAPMNDALLSGSLSFGAGAAPSLILLWDRTHASRNPVRGISGVSIMPNVLVTRNPNIHSIADYTDHDRIALPSAKLSNAAIVLEIAAAKRWGQANYAQLDSLAVSMGHPDAVAQVLGNGEITSHFASPPYDELELHDPRIHTVLSSVDVMGDTTLTDVWATTSFVQENPTVTQAVFDAILDAIDTISRDKSAAADLYLQLSHDKIAKTDLMNVLNNPHIRYSNVPLGTMAFATFMHQVGTLKSQPDDWKAFFFPIAQTLPGN
jgi:NitT/TauT family transport system substrate-binding protein